MIKIGVLRGARPQDGLGDVMYGYITASYKTLNRTKSSSFIVWKCHFTHACNLALVGVQTCLTIIANVDLFVYLFDLGFKILSTIFLQHENSR